MYGFWARFGTFAIAAALLFAAMRVHRSTGKHTKVTKQVGLVLAFLAGCALLVTFVGSWMASLAAAAGAFFVAGLIACAAIIAVDWFLDGKPDRPAFWAAFFLAGMIVFGAAAIPKATGQIGDGANRVGTQIQRVGR